MKIYETKKWIDSIGSIVITPDQVQQIDNIQQKYNISSSDSTDIYNIANIVRYSVNSNIEEQLLKIWNIKQPKACSLDNYKIKYGEDTGTAMYNEKKRRCKPTLDNFIYKYGIDEGTRRYNLVNSKKLTSLDNLIRRHGEVNGRRKWEEFKSKCSKNFTLDSMIKRNGVDNGTAKYNELMKHFDVFGTVEYYKDRHGEIEGEAKFKERISKLNHASSREGYIEKYGDAGVDIMKYMKDNTSLEAYILRHGIDEGTSLYNKRTIDKKFANTLDGYISRYGSVDGPIRYDKWIRTCTFTSGVSKISQRLCWDIYNRIDNNKSIYFHELNQEFALKLPDRVYLYDFVSMYHKKCIEFNGDMYHANPSIYKSTDIPYKPSGLTSQEIWDYDKLKSSELMLHRGYSTLIVWEYDYRNNPEETVQKCINFLVNNI